jgi:hypothetical protein
MRRWKPAFASALIFTALGLDNAEKSTRLVLPEVRMDAKEIRLDESIPITLTIRNNLSVAVFHCTKSLEPTNQNGETSGINLHAVYRRQKPIPELLKVTGRPQLKYPLMENGYPCHRIEPGGRLTIKTDLRKWMVEGGWQAGKYSASLKVDGLTPEGDSLTTIAAVSELFEFEIK